MKCVRGPGPVPDARLDRVSNAHSTLALGRPGINGAKGGTENEWGESHSVLLAADGLRRGKHFPLDAWLGKERENKSKNLSGCGKFGGLVQNQNQKWE